MSEETDKILEVAKRAAKVGAEILLQAFGKLDQKQISLKGAGDYVTEIDRESEKAIINLIKEKFPDHGIYAEESGKENRKSLYRWLIDPLDGTANYVQGIPIFGISIALVKEEETQVGLIYYPERDEMFWAVKGEGAFLNDRRIHISAKKDMALSMLASGFPWRSKDYLDPYLASFRELFLSVAGVRRMGSAAIDLAYTACGRFDGFWEMKLKPWDISAGILLVEEAGGVVTDFKGGKGYIESGNVVAGNSFIHEKILNTIRPYLSQIE